MSVALRINSISPGSSVQDGGRFGAQRFGLPSGGAMDLLSLAIANTLAGNAPMEAAIEIGPMPTSITAKGGAIRLALSGCTRPVAINGNPIGVNQSFTLTSGEVLTLGFARDGVFSYLAYAGGVRGEPMFGSKSVNARAGLGTPFPRSLQAGDELAASETDVSSIMQLTLPDQPKRPIRVVWGPQDDEFGDEEKALFVSTDWRVSALSDRMGYRLEGPAIKHQNRHNIVSDGTVIGSIQVPGDGKPIVLMPDRGTTGGYPKIAAVISSDLGRMAQLPPGAIFSFAAISISEAQTEARRTAELIRSLPRLMHPAGEGSINLDALVSANLAGIAVDASDSGSWDIGTQGDKR